MGKRFDLLEMFSRQLIVREVGVNGQLRLLESRVAVIGCGATGTATVELLVRAGIGYVRIIDRDIVELSNISRSHLHTVEDAMEAKPKALSCAEKLMKINPYARIDYVVSEVNPRNIEDLVKDVDIIVDGTDNMMTRYLINDASLKLSKPWVMQGASTWYGQVILIRPRVTACLRCLMPEPPPEVGNACSILGTMNTTISLITSISANEVIKHILGLSSGGELIYVDALRNQVTKFRLVRNPSCPACSQNKLEFITSQEFIRVKRVCGSHAVQVYPEKPVNINTCNVQGLSTQSPCVKVVLTTPYLLKALVEDYEVVLFNDGRAIINGLTDGELAMRIYNELMKNLFTTNSKATHCGL
ncbi:MAG: HesA/MoeB/ThiF family protein [Zestosphaera sp.]